MNISIRENCLPVRELEKEIKIFFKGSILKDLKQTINEKSFKITGYNSKFIHYLNIPIEVVKYLSEMKIKKTAKYATTLENLMEQIGLDAESVVEIMGEESIIEKYYKKGSKDKKPKNYNPTKTLINITDKKLIEALDSGKILYHIATIPINDDISEHISRETYAELFGSLFESPIFEGFIVLETSKLKSYIGFY